MQAIAKLNNLRMSAKKVRLVAGLIRGLKVQEAVTQLEFLPKAAARPILKLLQSAVANAENNHNLKRDNLLVKEIKVDMASTLKRWRARAHGRATPIRKKLSSTVIILSEIVPTKAKAAKAVKIEKPIRVKSKDEIREDLGSADKVRNEQKTVAKDHEKEIEKEIEDVRMEGKHRHKQNEDKRQGKKGAKGFMKKMFSRKAG